MNHNGQDSNLNPDHSVIIDLLPISIFNEHFPQLFYYMYLNYPFFYSLMVEELAECKNQLNNKTVNLQLGIKQLLDERCRVRDMLLCTYKNLYSLHERWLENIAISEYVGSSKVYNRPIGNLNFNTTVPHSTNIIDLSSVNLKLSENISSSVEKQDISHIGGLPIATDGEKYAEDVSYL